tara:strand:- start:861 stop:1106 length:246 start_codon:yes stop_codon:yes gene_type:complete
MAESRSIPNDFRKQMVKHSTENVITGLSTVLKKNILRHRQNMRINFFSLKKLPSTTLVQISEARQGGGYHVASVKLKTSSI